MKTLWWKRSCRKFSRTSSTRQANTTRSLLAKPLERCKTSRHKFSVASEASRGPNSACNCMEAPPPGCFVQLLNMWVCCLIPGLSWKLQREKEPNQKNDPLYFGLEQIQPPEGLCRRELAPSEINSALSLLPLTCDHLTADSACFHAAAAAAGRFPSAILMIVERGSNKIRFSSERWMYSSTVCFHEMWSKFKAQTS